MKKYWFIVALVPVLMVAPCFAQTPQAQKDLGHVMLTPTQVQWQAGPGSLPPGAQLAVLDRRPVSGWHVIHYRAEDA